MRRTGALLTVAAVLAAVLTASLGPAAGPAGALAREGMTVSEGETVEKAYPGIAGNDPITVTAGIHPTPADCEASPSCDYYPLEVIVPDGFDPEFDEFFLVIEVSWDPTDTDTDVFFYDDGQLAEAEGETGYTELSSSASSANPEVIKTRNATLGRYNIVAVNFAGASTEIRIKVTYNDQDFTTPTEKLAPKPTTTTTTTKATTTTSTSTTSTSAPPTTTTTSTLAIADVVADDDFDRDAFEKYRRAADEGDIIIGDDQLQQAAALFGEDPGDGSTSGLALLVWLAVFPVALLGAAVAVLLRRRATLDI